MLYWRLSVDSGKRNIESCCVTSSLLCSLSLVVHYCEERYHCTIVIRCCRCAVHSRAELSSSVANLAVFPRIWACFFCGFVELRVFFEDLRVACFWACSIEIYLLFWAWFLHISVLRIAFFQMLWHFCCFKFILLKAYWACFCENLLILGLFFRICHHDFLFDFLADFCFVEFSCQRTLACFSVKLRILGLFFKFTYSWKITWDHC